MLNERVAKTQFKKVSNNLAKVLTNELIEPVEIDTEVDLMFENPGMLLSRGSQRVFTNIIRSLRVRPYRKSTFINLDRICCAGNEMCGYTPSDPMIWKSIRSTTLQRRSREFYWKCIHNTFRVRDFWTHIEHLEIIGTCQVCDVTEILEHIALECNSPEQKIIWTLTRELWSRKYDTWPTLNWGLTQGANNGALVIRASVWQPHDVHQEKPSFPLRQISKSNISTTMHGHWKLPVAASVLQAEGL
jgi:hypothetical protein